MAGKRGWSNAVPVSDLTAGILDPVLRKRTGLSLTLVESWEEIVGPRLAALSRPEKIQWSRRSADDVPYEPATLIVACQGLAALHLQHETTQVIERANAMLGFGAIGRIRIVQKPVPVPVSNRPKPPKPLNQDQSARLAAVVSGVEDDTLRQSLERWGASIVGSKR